MQHLVLRQRRGFGSEVGVLDAATSVGSVFRDVGQVVDSVLEAVLNSTEVSTLGVDRSQGVIDYRDGVLGAVGSGDVDAGNAALLRGAGVAEDLRSLVPVPLTE